MCPFDKPEKPFYPSGVAKTPAPSSTPLNVPAYPDVMVIEQVAEAMAISVKTIYAQLAAGTFRPLPFAELPKRWRGEDLARWYRGEFREVVEQLRKQARKSA